MSSSRLSNSFYYNKLLANRIQANSIKSKNMLLNNNNITIEDDTDDKFMYRELQGKYFYTITVNDFKSNISIVDNSLRVILTISACSCTRFTDRPMHSVLHFNSMEKLSKEFLDVFSNISNIIDLPNVVLYLDDKHHLFELYDCNIDKNNNLVIYLSTEYDSKLKQNLENYSNNISLFIDSVDISSNWKPGGQAIKPLRPETREIKLVEDSHLEEIGKASLPIDSSGFPDKPIAPTKITLQNYQSFNNYVSPRYQQQHNKLFYPGANYLLNMNNLNLMYMQFYGSVLYRVSFANTILSNSDLREATFINCLFNNSILVGNALNNTQFINCIFINCPNIGKNSDFLINSPSKDNIIDPEIINDDHLEYNSLFSYPNLNLSSGNQSLITNDHITKICYQRAIYYPITDMYYIDNNIITLDNEKNNLIVNNFPNPQRENIINTISLNYDNDYSNKIYLPYQFEKKLSLKILNLENVNLSNSVFYRCDFSYSYFGKNTNLDNVTFIECIFNNTIFDEKIDLNNLNFVRSTFWHIKFNLSEQNNLNGISFYDLFYKWQGFPSKLTQFGGNIVTSTNDIVLINYNRLNNIKNENYLEYMLSKFNKVNEFFGIN